MIKIIRNTFALSLLVSTASFAAGFAQSIKNFAAMDINVGNNSGTSNLPVATAVVVAPSASVMAHAEVIPDILENAPGFEGKMLSDGTVQDTLALVNVNNFTSQDVLNIGYYIDEQRAPAGAIRLIKAAASHGRYILVDDSGSMDFTNSTWYDVTENCVKKTTKRFEELRNRLHQFVKGFAYLPAQETLTISFLNRTNVLNFSRGELEIDRFTAFMHTQIDNAFAAKAEGITPVYEKLKEIYNSPDPKLVYLFCDGEPTIAQNGRVVDDSERVKNLIVNVRNAEKFPTVLVSISDDDRATQWMKDADKDGMYTAELDDMITELSEIIRAHGIGITYMFAPGETDFLPASMSDSARDRFARDIVSKLNTRKLDEIITDKTILIGLLKRYEPIWLLSHQFAAIDSKGLDALDEKGEKLTAEVFGDLIGIDFTHSEENLSNTQKYNLYDKYHPITLGIDHAKGYLEKKETAQTTDELRAAQPKAENTAKKSKYARALAAAPAVS